MMKLPKKKERWNLDCLSNKEINAFTRGHKLITDFRIIDSCGVNQKKAYDILKKCENIKILKLYDINFIDFDFILNFKDLEELCLSNVNLTRQNDNNFMSFIDMNKIKKIMINCNYLIDIDSFGYLLYNCQYFVFEHKNLNIYVSKNSYDVKSSIFQIESIFYDMDTFFLLYKNLFF